MGAQVAIIVVAPCVAPIFPLILICDSGAEAIFSSHPLHLNRNSKPVCSLTVCWEGGAALLPGETNTVAGLSCSKNTLEYSSHLKPWNEASMELQLSSVHLEEVLVLLESP